MRTVTSLVALLAISAGEVLAECSPSADRQAEMKAKVELVQSLSPNSAERRAALEELHALARDRAGCEATVTYRGHAVPPAADVSMTANQQERAAILTTLQTESLQPEERKESLTRLLDLTKEQVKRQEEQKQQLAEPVEPGFIGAPCLAIAREGQVAFYEDWSDGNFDGWDFRDKCSDDNFRVVRDPMKPSNAVLRVHNTVGVCGTSGGHASARTELTNPSFTVQIGEPFYWSQRIFVPQDWPDSETMGENRWATVMQIIGGSHDLGWDPDFKLRLHGGGVWVWDGPGGGRWPARRGDWTTIEVFYVRSTGGGTVQVMIDGEQIINFHGQTTFANVGAAWKLGIYTVLGWSKAPLTLLFDDTIIATGKAFARCQDDGDVSAEN